MLLFILDGTDGDNHVWGKYWCCKGTRPGIHTGTRHRRWDLILFRSKKAVIQNFSLRLSQGLPCFGPGLAHKLVSIELMFESIFYAHDVNTWLLFLLLLQCKVWPEYTKPSSPVLLQALTGEPYHTLHHIICSSTARDGRPHLQIEQ